MKAKENEKVTKAIYCYQTGAETFLEAVKYVMELYERKEIDDKEAKRAIKKISRCRIKGKE